VKVFITAGEASGDKLGAALIDGLRSIDPNLELVGIAGPLMQAKGMQSLFDMSELSLMGIAEILPKYMHLKRRIAETARAVVNAKPDVLITIDSPDFSLRVAKLVKSESNIPTVHYVAPTVWAWRAGRAEKMARYIDHVLSLFPFEPPLMTKAGMSCDFVGHPVVSEPVANSDDIVELSQKLGLEPERPVILALAGSRRGEATRLAPIFGSSLKNFVQQHPEAQVLTITTEQTHSIVHDSLECWPQNTCVLSPDGRIPDEFQRLKRAAFKRADMAIAASGTVSLELAAAETPMIITYDMNWVSRQILKRMLLTDTVTLVNLVSGTRAVPEFLGAECTSSNIRQALETLWDDQSRQSEAMAVTMQRLGQGGEDPGLRAAKSVQGFLSQNS